MPPEDVPHHLHGHRLGLVARLRWFLGLKPWERCPDDLHRWRNIYGDEIIQAGGMRAGCLDCSARSPLLQDDTHDRVEERWAGTPHPTRPRALRIPRLKARS